VLEVLKHLVGGQHQFASDGLLLMLVGGLGVYLRAIPERLWHWLVDQSTMTITVKDDDAAFVWVKEWFLEQKFLARIRRVDLDTTIRHEQPSFIPAQGRHWFWHSGRPFLIDFYRSDEKKGYAYRRTEWLTFTTIGRRQIFLMQFVRAIVASHEQRLAMISSLYIRDDDYWQRVPGYQPRLLDSVILRPGEKDQLVADIEKFKATKLRYRQLGVPYHRGYLFYGPPGTGKTSLVSALAARFGMSIYVISLTEFNDKSLMKAVHDVPLNSVILFEDIDCMKTGKARLDAEDRAKRNLPPGIDEKASSIEGFNVTLSGLLNVLDGFNAPENVLFVMTTNQIEALDHALLRPGRIDYRLYLGKAAREQKIELYHRFFPETTLADALSFVAANAHAETMAEFQGLLLGLEQGSAAPSHETVVLDL
jgi:mitochondrial chaperone BCS1